MPCRARYANNNIVPDSQILSGIFEGFNYRVQNYFFNVWVISLKITVKLYGLEVVNFLGWVTCFTIGGNRSSWAGDQSRLDVMSREIDLSIISD